MLSGCPHSLLVLSSCCVCLSSGRDCFFSWCVCVVLRLGFVLSGCPHSLLVLSPGCACVVLMLCLSIFRS